MPRERLYLLACVLGASALYLPGLFIEEFLLDDRKIVMESPVVREDDFAGALNRPWWAEVEQLRSAAPNWRPLATLSFVVEHAIHGTPVIPDLDARPFHFVNILLYGCTVLAFWPLARRLVGPGPSALLATLLFAVHPAHVEAVSPIVGRADLLAALGALLALEAYCRWRETGHTGFAIGSVLAYLCAMGGKEAPILVPALLPFVDVLLRRERWRDVALRPAAWLWWTPLVGAAGLYLVARASVLGEATLLQPNLAEASPLGTRLLGVGRNTVTSARLLVAPLETHHILTTLPTAEKYTWPVPTGTLGDWLRLFGGLALGFGWIGCVRRWPTVAFCWVAAAAMWLPTSGILPIGGGVALRFLFLPSVFFVCAVARGIEALGARAGPQAGTVRGTAAAVLGTLGAIVTLAHEREWQSNFALHDAVLAQVPNCYGSVVSRGAAYSAEGKRAEAMAELARAQQMDPEGVDWRWNLMQVHLMGLDNKKFGAGSNFEEARRIGEEILARDDNNWAAAYDLAWIVYYGSPDRIEECIKALERVLALRPSPPDSIQEGVRENLRLLREKLRRKQEGGEEGPRESPPR